MNADEKIAVIFDHMKSLLAPLGWRAKVEKTEFASVILFRLVSAERTYGFQRAVCEHDVEHLWHGDLDDLRRMAEMFCRHAIAKFFHEVEILQPVGA